MDMNSSTKFLYDLGTIMLGRDFSQGGFFGLDDKTVVFDRDELPKSFILKEGTFITFGNNNFRVAEYKLWDNSNYLLIKAKHVQADHIPTFHKRHSKSSLEVLSGVPS